MLWGHIKGFLIYLRCHDRDTVYTSLHHAANATLQPPGVVVGVREDDINSLLGSQGFKCIDQFGKEGIINVRDNKAKHASAADAEASRMSIRHIVHRGDDTADVSGGLLAHVGGAVQHTRNSSGRHFSALGNLLD